MTHDLEEALKAGEEAQKKRDTEIQRLKKEAQHTRKAYARQAAAEIGARLGVSRRVPTPPSQRSSASRSVTPTRKSPRTALITPSVQLEPVELNLSQTEVPISEREVREVSTNESAGPSQPLKYCW